MYTYNTLSIYIKAEYNSIATKLVKQIKLIIVEPLTVIINQMLNTGIFPDLLKLAKITLINKNDDDNDIYMVKLSHHGQKKSVCLYHI